MKNMINIKNEYKKPVPWSFWSFSDLLEFFWIKKIMSSKLLHFLNFFTYFTYFMDAALFMPYQQIKQESIK